MNGPRITGLSVEHDAESVVGTATPRLSWQTVTDTSGWLQAQYEVRITPADGDSSSSDWVALRRVGARSLAGAGTDVAGATHR